MLDEYGYPTEEALEKIKEWPDDDMPGLIGFVKELWWMPDWGWHEKNEDDHIHYLISTGGWSGNEDLIGAMGSNQMFWLFCWYSSRVGGHFQFKVKVRELGED